jgi:hypothetical protein
MADRRLFFFTLAFSYGSHVTPSSYLVEIFLLVQGLYYEIDFENVDENLQMLALIRAADGL